MKKNKKGLLIVLLLLMGIGFASASTILYITGTVSIKPDTQDFEENVKFHSVSVDETSAVAGTVASIEAKNEVEGKQISFTTHGLKNIGEEVTLTYTIENTSQYDAELGSLTCTKASGDDDWSTYLDVTPGNALSGTTLQKGNGTTTGISAEDTIKIKMIRSYKDTAKAYTFQCTMSATAE